MTTSVHHILAPLEPYWDRIVRRPLSDESLARLEQVVGLPLPQCLREYLQVVGLFQDLTYVEHNPIFVFEALAEYGAARRDLLDGLYGEIDMKLLPFGHDDAGDLYAVRASGENDPRILFLRQDIPAAEATDMTFCGWLETIVTKALETIDQRRPNQAKTWRVQFTFRGGDIDAILQVMEQVGSATLEGDWQHVETTQTGVGKATAQISFGDQQLMIRRLEYPQWIAPWYFVDMAEPLDVNGSGSVIEKLDDLFREQIPGYGLINFGAVEQNEGEAYADAPSQH
ncbi:MAG: SMI1/KNR4 family protein [Anaerolineae bacterium]|nr:SMI1/KNR4 family protein [Anaerolineae bacterium]